MKKKILVADSSPSIFQSLLSHKKASSYDWEKAIDGLECLKKLESFNPDLVILDLLLPKKHGISILNTIKASFPKVTVMIASDQMLLQNYKTAIDHGAVYFLFKPLDLDHVFVLLDQYEKNKLSPNSFPKLPRPNLNKRDKTSPLALTFWGTRGSHSISGPEFERFGGNTSCLEILHEKDRIIIDAGTGIHELGKKLRQEKVKKIDILISHTHLDHIIGFPFFEPIYDKEVKITVWGPVGFELSLQKIFESMLSPSFFPIGLNEISAQLEFKELNTEKIAIGSFTVHSCYTYHPGATLGFRIDTPNHKIGYVTDNELFLGHVEDPSSLNPDHPHFLPHKDLYQFLKPCDTIVHEAQYFDFEYEAKVGWGHSCISNATSFLRHTNAKRWIVTHHDPNHTDKDLEFKTWEHLEALQKYDFKCRFDLAHDEMYLPLN